MNCFVVDHEGAWYKLPVALRDEFYDYLDGISNEDFMKYRCLHPCNYMFSDLQVLKESS